MELRIVKGIALIALWMGITLGLRAQTVVEYVHTDALGTPVAITNAAGTVIERSEYEPYGQLINRPLTDGPGFTGHVQDAATGLTYMQQRYYDPAIGRFLSVDPVTANSGTGANFNRYWYANNNPYRFTDPDGRLSNDCLGSFCDRYRDPRRQQCEKTCVNHNGREGRAKEKYSEETYKPAGSAVDLAKNLGRWVKSRTTVEAGATAALGGGVSYKRDLKTKTDKLGVVILGAGFKIAPGAAVVAETIGVGGDLKFKLGELRWQESDSPATMDFDISAGKFGAGVSFDGGGLTFDVSANPYGAGAYVGLSTMFDDTLVPD